MTMLNEEITRATMSAEDIEAIDAKVGEKRARNRRSIEDIKMERELRRNLHSEISDDDLTSDEYHSIFS